MSLLSTRITDTGDKTDDISEVKEADQICQHPMYGYCKFQTQCQKIHVQGQHEAFAACNGIKSCKKRHPKVCKRFEIEKYCKFGRECAYAHLKSSNVEEYSKLEDTVISNIANMKAELIGLKHVIQKLALHEVVVSQGAP